MKDLYWWIVENVAIKGEIACFEQFHLVNCNVFKSHVQLPSVWRNGFNLYPHKAADSFENISTKY